MGILRESVDHREQNALAMDLRKRLDEVEGNVNPDARRDRQRLQQAGRVQCFCFVPLARGAGADEIAHHTAIMLDKELSAESVKSLLDASMAPGMGQLQDVLE